MRPLSEKGYQQAVYVITSIWQNPITTTTITGMPLLTLVKHAQPQIQPHLPARQWELSPAGRAQSLLLAARLRSWQPHRIVTSDEPKAVDTGRIIASHLRLKSTIHPDLHEHAREHVPFRPTVEAFQADLRRFFASPQEVVYGEESADAAHRRFTRAVTEVIQSAPGKHIVIVAHGTVITLFVTRLFQLDPYPFWLRLDLPSYVILSQPPWEMRCLVPSIIS